MKNKGFPQIWESHSQPVTDMWAFNFQQEALLQSAVLLPSNFLPKTEVVRQRHFYDYEELLNSGRRALSHYYFSAANTQ